MNEPPRELRVRFWTLILLIKATVLVVAGAILAIVFMEAWVGAAALLGIAGYLIFRTVHTYRRLHAVD